MMTMVLLAATLNTTAQEDDLDIRGHIEHVGSHSVPSSDSPLRKIGTLASAPLTNLGSPKVPVVLVQFPDLPFTVGETEEAINQTYQDHFNAPEDAHPGLSLCSVKTYFEHESGGLFTPEFDMIGPVTLSKSSTYYGEDRGSSKDIHINEFYREACQQAMQTYAVEWDKYDNDGNGIVDYVFFIFAGQGQNQKGTETSTIWPKEGLVHFTVEGDDFTVTFGSAGCASELYKNKMDGVGACVHELCHGLGLPDFYDYNYKAYGMDYWDVMDSGCYKINGRLPIGLSAYELDFLEWRKLEELHPDSAYSLTLDPLETGGVAYKVVNKANPDEYFILENRQNTGMDKCIGYAVSTQYNQYGANHGLMITHVNYSSSAWNSNTVNTTEPSRQRFTIVPADGEVISSVNLETSEEKAAWALSQHGDLYPGDNNVTEISSYAVFTGETLGQTIDNIVEHEDGTITLDINGGKIEDPEDPEDPQDPEDPEIPEDPLEEPDIPEIS